MVLALLLKSLSTANIGRFLSHENKLSHCVLGFTRTVFVESRRRKKDFTDLPAKPVLVVHL